MRRVALQSNVSKVKDFIRFDAIAVEYCIWKEIEVEDGGMLGGEKLIFGDDVFGTGLAGFRRFLTVAAEGCRLQACIHKIRADCATP